MKTIFRFLYLLLIVCLSFSCNNKKDSSSQVSDSADDYYTNPLLPDGSLPWAIFHDGIYYYTQNTGDQIVIWKTTDITDLEKAEKKLVWVPTERSNSFNLWGPQIHRINNKWYIYFAADDGNTDNHQIYVIENESDDPFVGEFRMKGRVSTDKDNNWAIHANVFQHRGEWYMIWSGWQTRRIETETQCIYIAKMKNPWTLASDRVMISKPEYEWERQWINPDGSKTPYPIHVNECPRYYHTKRNDKVLVFYSASGTWTPYYSVGMLSAGAHDDLLDPTSWTKSKTPVYKQSPENSVFSPGNVSFIPSPDQTEIYFIYQACSHLSEASGGRRSPRMQKLDWDDQGYPVFGKPLPESQKIRKPSGSK